MKMGLALHMSMIEKASSEKWPINLLLTSVPDEEVNSAGMRVAVKELVRLRDIHGLTYKMFFNSEPSFPKNRGIQKEYIYSGTIGKIMPSALFYGKETHVGEPMKGITANYIASFLTQLMEWNPSFRETDLRGEHTITCFITAKGFKNTIFHPNPVPCCGIVQCFPFETKCC